MAFFFFLKHRQQYVQCFTISPKLCQPQTCQKPFCRVRRAGVNSQGSRIAGGALWLQYAAVLYLGIFSTGDYCFVFCFFSFQEILGRGGTRLRERKHSHVFVSDMYAFSYLAIFELNLSEARYLTIESFSELIYIDIFKHQIRNISSVSL